MFSALQLWVRILTCGDLLRWLACKARSPDVPTSVMTCHLPHRSEHHHLMLSGNHALRQCFGEAKGASSGFCPSSMWACHNSPATIL